MHTKIPPRDIDAGPHTLFDLRHRPRRLRRSAGIRTLVRETWLSPYAFLYPLFVCGGRGHRHEAPSTQGVFQLSVDAIVREATAAHAEGLPGVLLFGLPDEKVRSGPAPTIPRGTSSPPSAH